MKGPFQKLSRAFSKEEGEMQSDEEEEWSNQEEEDDDEDDDEDDGELDSDEEEFDFEEEEGDSDATSGDVHAEEKGREEQEVAELFEKLEVSAHGSMDLYIYIYKSTLVMTPFLSCAPPSFLPQCRRAVVEIEGLHTWTMHYAFFPSIKLVILLSRCSRRAKGRECYEMSSAKVLRISYRSEETFLCVGVMSSLTKILYSF
jgi:hypothetical protein